MSKKLILGVIVSAIAVLSIVCGLCFTFIGTKNIVVVPNSLSIEKIDDNVFVVSEYNPEYSYKFKIKQVIDGEEVLIDNVLSKNNTLDLLKQKVNFYPGVELKISVCFCNADGTREGNYSEPISWLLTKNLKNIDYTSVVLDANTQILTWQNIENADFYSIKYLDKDLKEIVLNSDVNSLDLSSLKIGKYTMFIAAHSIDRHILSSIEGNGKEIIISRKNKINSAVKTPENGMVVKSSELVENFVVYVDDRLKANIKIDVSEVKIVDGVYVYNIAPKFLVNVDFSSSNIKLKSLQFNYAKESDLISL